MRHGWMQVVLVVAAIARTAGHEAAAAVCFPYAGGVPGATGNGPPDWWSPMASLTGSETVSWRDDPRWRGAFSDMVMNNEKFRVVVENTGGVQYLVMYWEVKSDSTGAGDKLYFGVWDDVSATGNIYRLTRNTADETLEDAGGTAPSAFSGQIFGGKVVAGSVTWTAAPAGSALPAWLTDYTRVDVDCTIPPSGNCDIWAIRIRARIEPAANTADATPSGIKISDATPPAATRTFRFWYQIQDNTTVGTTPYSFPSGAATANETVPSFPDPSAWKPAQLGTSSSCDGDILFNSGNVYVNSVGSTQLDLTSNTFHATPRNNAPATSISNSELTARFRIANWGSATFASPEWKETCTAGGSGTLVTYQKDFERSCTWPTLDPCAYQPANAGCGATAGTKDPHQCVLVDLGLGTTTKHYTFSTQSVYRNMNFDVNSTLVRQATIDIKGLGPMPGGAANRDVFLYVHTHNLPGKIADEPPVPAAGDQGADHRINIGNILPPRQRFKELDLPATGAIGTKESARIQAAVQAGKLTLEQVEQIMPTYIVYVWHDTGRTLTTAAGPSKILEAQPSFGLFLAHDGDLEGWKHQLTGAGAVLVGPNLYKFSPPNDSTFPVTITIEPIECTGLRCWLPTWIWIFLGLLLLLLILYFLFGKKQPPASTPVP